MNEGEELDNCVKTLIDLKLEVANGGDMILTPESFIDMIDNVISLTEQKKSYLEQIEDLMEDVAMYKALLKAKK